MAKKKGRPSAYDTLIAPHIEEIKEAVKAGATIAEIADAFDISESTIYKYKAEKKEFAEAFTHGRAKICIRVRAALLKKAEGFYYEEEKKVGKKDKDGENIILVEKYKRYSPPSETAAAMILRNYDEKWLDRDSSSTNMRQQEFELKKAIAESTNFDLDFNSEGE